ncbi:hypothetical protein G6L68_25290 [Agrobacterium fabrum]|uniref:hypothetical protein n=1 Tax=Agrobacterium fabrum TaxID=1176649 RepID=UPI000EF5A1F2|nr:hypothetical protein [Agrobacterium fabrum]AYM66203.1 hypothetical protein At12D13_50510 [Agrobacterium fabrum]NTE63949.1 hypothetical protein [Agrobacterium fabrum]
MRLAVALAVAAAVVGGVAVADKVFDWSDLVERNKEGWRLCHGWIDATPEERAKMPAWCEDWATGDE